MALKHLRKRGRIRFMEKEDDDVEAKYAEVAIDAEDAEDIGGGGDDEGYITIKQIEQLIILAFHDGVLIKFPVLMAGST